MLNVKKLSFMATLPTVAHVGEDLGYDLYALEQTWVYRNQVTKVSTGIACAAYMVNNELRTMPVNYIPLGLLIKDRSSMAAKGVFTHGGVIDAGYRGEIIVTMTTILPAPYNILAGDKIAQMVPVMVLTGEVTESDLPESFRGNKGFGSSGA